MNRLNKILLSLTLLLATALPALAEERDYYPINKFSLEYINGDPDIKVGQWDPGNGQKITFDEPIQTSFYMVFALWSDADFYTIKFCDSDSKIVPGITYTSTIKEYTYRSDQWNKKNICVKILQIDNIPSTSNIQHIKFILGNDAYNFTGKFADGMTYDEIEDNKINLGSLTNIYVTPEEYKSMYGEEYGADAPAIPHPNFEDDYSDFKGIWKAEDGSLLKDRTIWTDPDSESQDSNKGMKQLNYSNGSFTYDLGKLADSSAPYTGKKIYLRYPSDKHITGFTVKSGTEWGDEASTLNVEPEEFQILGDSWQSLKIPGYTWIGYEGTPSYIQLPGIVTLDDNQYLKITPVGDTLSDGDLMIYMTETDWNACAPIGYGTSDEDKTEYLDRILWKGDNGQVRKDGNMTKIDLGGKTTGKMRLLCTPTDSETLTITATLSDGTTSDITANRFSEGGLESNGYRIKQGYKFEVTNATNLEITGISFIELGLDSEAWEDSPWIGYADDDKPITIEENYTDRCASKYKNEPEISGETATFDLLAPASSEGSVDAIITFHSSQPITTSDISIDDSNPTSSYTKLTDSGYEVTLTASLAWQGEHTLTAPGLTGPVRVLIKKADWISNKIAGWDDYQTPHKVDLTAFYKPTLSLEQSRSGNKNLATINFTKKISVKEMVVGVPMYANGDISKISTDNLKINNLDNCTVSEISFTRTNFEWPQIPNDKPMHYVLYKVELPEDTPEFDKLELQIKDDAGVNGYDQCRIREEDGYWYWITHAQIYITEDDYNDIYNDPTPDLTLDDITQACSENGLWKNGKQYKLKNRIIWTDADANGQTQLMRMNDGSLTFDLGKLADKDKMSYDGKTIYITYPKDKQFTSFTISSGSTRENCDNSVGSFNLQYTKNNNFEKFYKPEDTSFNYIGYYPKFENEKTPACVKLNANDQYIKIVATGENFYNVNISDIGIFMSEEEWAECAPVGLDGSSGSADDEDYTNRILWEGQVVTEPDGTVKIDLGGKTTGKLMINAVKISDDFSIKVDGKPVKWEGGSQEILTESGYKQKGAYYIKVEDASTVEITGLDFQSIGLHNDDWENSPYYELGKKVDIPDTFVERCSTKYGTAPTISGNTVTFNLSPTEESTGSIDSYITVYTTTPLSDATVISLDGTPLTLAEKYTHLTDHGYETIFETSIDWQGTHTLSVSDTSILSFGIRIPKAKWDTYPVPGWIDSDTSLEVHIEDCKNPVPASEIIKDGNNHITLKYDNHIIASEIVIGVPICSKTGADAISKDNLTIDNLTDYEINDFTYTIWDSPLNTTNNPHYPIYYVLYKVDVSRISDGFDTLDIKISGNSITGYDQCGTQYDSGYWFWIMYSQLYLTSRDYSNNMGDDSAYSGPLTSDFSDESKYWNRTIWSGQKTISGNNITYYLGEKEPTIEGATYEGKTLYFTYSNATTPTITKIVGIDADGNEHNLTIPKYVFSESNFVNIPVTDQTYNYCGYYDGGDVKKNYPIAIALDGDYQKIRIEADGQFTDPEFYMSISEFDAVPWIGWKDHKTELTVSASGTWHSRILGSHQTANAATTGIDLGGNVSHAFLNLSFTNPTAPVTVIVKDESGKELDKITYSAEDLNNPDKVSKFRQLTADGYVDSYNILLPNTYHNARYVTLTGADFKDIKMEEGAWKDNPWVGYESMTPKQLKYDASHYTSRCDTKYGNAPVINDAKTGATIDLKSSVGKPSDPVDVYLFFDVSKEMVYMKDALPNDIYYIDLTTSTTSEGTTSESEILRRNISCDILDQLTDAALPADGYSHKVAMKVTLYGESNLNLTVKGGATISNLQVKMSGSDWIAYPISGWDSPNEETSTTNWQGGKYKDYEFVHTRGIMEDLSQDIRTYKDAVDYGYDKTTGKWTKDITTLSELGIKVPDCSWLTSADDPRIGAGLKYQRTHTVEHDIYLLPGQTAMLHPYYLAHVFQYHDALVRWYDYNTDRVGTGGNTYLSMPEYDRENVIKTKYGYFGGRVMVPNPKSQTAATGDNEDPYHSDYRGLYASITWSGENDLPDNKCIAADLSNAWNDGYHWTDFNSSTSKSMLDLFLSNEKMTEPVISIRHLFNIHDARKFAEELSATKDANKKYIEKHRRIIDAPQGTANFHIRLDFPAPGASNGTDYNQKSQYFYRDESTGNYEQVEQYVYKTFNVSNNGKLTEITTDGFVNYTTKTAIAQNDSYQNNKITGKSEFYRAISCGNLPSGKYIVKAYASDKTGTNIIKTADGLADLQLFEFEVNFLDEDMTSIKKGDAIPEKHSIKTLEAKYGSPIDKIDFDEYAKIISVKQEESNLYPYRSYKASETEGTYYKWPLPWDECSYMFGYNNFGNWNEYAILKNLTALNGTSGNFIDGNTPTGRDAGYFFYVNAAADPGYMVKLNVNDLCMGTTFYVSAWFAETTGTTDVADIAFNFIAETYEGEEIILHTYQTGAIPVKEEWMHIYYEFMPDLRGYDESKVRRYYLRLDNNTVGSIGADYCIDDIRLYAAKPEVDAFQVRPLCDGEESTDMRIQTPFRAFLGSVGQQATTDESNESEIDVYYSFVDADKYESLMRSTSVPDEFKYNEKTGKGYKNVQEYAYGESVLRYNYMKEKDEDGNDVKTTYGVIPVHICYNLLAKYSGGINEDDYEVNTAYRPSEGNGDNLLLFFTRPSIEGGMQIGKRYSILIFSPLAEDIEAGVEIDDKYINDSFYDYDYFGNCTKTASFYVQGSSAVKIDGFYDAPSNSVSSCSNKYPEIKVRVGDFNYGTTNAEREALVDKLAAIPLDWLSWPKSTPILWPEGVDKPSSLPEKYTDKDVVKAIWEAMVVFRHAYPDAEVFPSEFEEKESARDWTESEYKLIKHFIDSNNLILYQTSFKTETLKQASEEGLKQDYVLYAFPNDKKIDDLIGDDSHLVCPNPIEMQLLFDGSEPKLYHGLKNIQYPSGIGDDVPVRIGSEQIVAATAATDKEEDVKKTVPLWIPIRKIETVSAGAKGVQKRKIDEYSTKYETEDKEIKDISRNFSSEIMLVDTDDPTYLKKIKDEDGNVTGIDVNTLDFDLRDRSHGNLHDTSLTQDHCIAFLTRLTASSSGETNFAEVVFRRGFHFNEGYSYTLRYQFEEDFDSDDSTSHDACGGYATFTLKIVPTFQKWNPRDNGNTWNDDKHWNRVNTKDVRTTVDKLPDYTAANTIYEPNGVFIDGKKDGEFINQNESSFVPMYFTKVLVPAYENADAATYDTKLADTKSYPVLIAEKNKAVDVYLHNGANEFTKYKMNFMETLDGEKVTKDVYLPINYEMDALPYERGDGGIDCGPFQPNTCDEIHFNAGSELKGQQYLDYNKAWLDFEIKPDVWSLMSSPLQKTFAGDMYTVRNGCRQATPLFEDINFIPHDGAPDEDHKHNDEIFNDRFGPAVYQRSWDRSNAWVYQMNSNGSWTELDKHEQYEYATGNHNSSSSAKDVSWVANWSRVYNYVYEGYSIDGNAGFSIKPVAENGSMTDGIETMSFRLPKADTFYDYYSKDLSTRGDHTAIVRGEWSNKSEVGKNPTYKNFEVRGEKITVSKSHRLNDMSLKSDGGYRGSLHSKSNGSTRYFLVGNPFICSMDMEKFLTANYDLIESKYWLLENGHSVTGFLDTSDKGWKGTTGVIPPMTGFFVKTLKDCSELDLVFTDDMQVLSQALSEKAPSQTRGSASDPEAFRIETAGSRTVVLIDPYASAEFDPEEDAEALLDMDCGEAPAVFTLASGLATSIDTRPEAEGIVLGMANAKKGTEIRFAGQWLDEVALDVMDLVSGERTPIADGTVYTVTDPAHRLMLVGAEAPELPSEVISIRRSGQYEVTVAAPEGQGTMEIVVTDMTGKVLRTIRTEETSWKIALPKGLYIVAVSTPNARRSASVII